MALAPKVIDAQLELEEFELTRISKAKGPLVHELGRGLRLVILEELESPKLVAKLNRAIEKKRHRLRFTPAALIKLNSLPNHRAPDESARENTQR